MRLFFIGLLSALLFTVQVNAETEDVSAYSPVIPLGADLTLQVNRDTPYLEVQTDGFIHFLLEVPELGEDFFSRHHLQINVPYFSNGYRRNHYTEVTHGGLFPVRIPSEEAVGTPIYLYNDDRRFIKSTAEWVITPIVQFFAVYQMLNYIGSFGDVPPYRPSIDFKHGGFLEGIQGYAILDSSLRFARDTTERLEVYHQMEPGGSSMTVAIIFATGALILNGVPIDTGRFNALSMQSSFIYSGLAGKLVDTGDELLITPKFSEKLFPSHGSVRNIKSKLASQIVRGPVLSAGLSVLDLPADGKDGQTSLVKDLFSKKLVAKPASATRQTDFVSPAKWLITKKLMIKSASETRQFHEMVGKNIDVLPARVVEWGLNGATVAFTGIDGPPGSLVQTFADEFQQQLGSHTLKQAGEFRDKHVTKPLMVHQPHAYLVVSQVLMDFAMGAVFYMMADTIDREMEGSGMVSGRYGKGLGLAFATKTIGDCVIEWVTGCATEFAHDQIAGISSEMAAFFRRDYLVEIGHGLTPEPEPKPDSGLRSHHTVHDEL